MRLIAANGPGPPLEPRGDLIGVRELFHHDLKATDLSSMTEKLSQRRHEMLGGTTIKLLFPPWSARRSKRGATKPVG